MQIPDTYYPKPFCAAIPGRLCPDPEVCPNAIFIRKNVARALLIGGNKINLTSQDIHNASVSYKAAASINYHANHLRFPQYQNFVQQQQQKQHEQLVKRPRTDTPSQQNPLLSHLMRPYNSYPRLPPTLPYNIASYNKSVGMSSNAPSGATTPAYHPPTPPTPPSSTQSDSEHPRQHLNRRYQSPIGITERRGPRTTRNKIIQCTWGDCTDRFATQESCLEHMKESHIGSKKSNHWDFTCRLRGCDCGGKSWSKRDNVVSHVTNTAFDIRYAHCPFKDRGCGIALKREWDLPRHIKICKYRPEGYKEI